MRLQVRRRRRRGASLVEFAFVAILLFMLVFGIIEFGLLVMTMNVMDNAVREGARYAIVNGNQGSSLTGQVQNQVDSRLGGVQNLLVGYSKTSSITVIAVDPSTGAQLLDASNNPVPPEGAQFGQAIQVRLAGTYKPLLPSLLFLPTSFTLQSTSMMTSEAN